MMSVQRVFLLALLVCSIAGVVVSGYVQDPPHLPIVTGDTTKPEGILASGFAMCFRKYQEIITITDTRPVIPNAGTSSEVSLNAQQGTMSIWWNSPNASPGSQLAGFGSDQGPMLGKKSSFIFPDGTNRIASWVSNIMTVQPTKELEWHDAYSANTAGWWNDSLSSGTVVHSPGTIYQTPIGPENMSPWHHIVMTWDSLRSEVYVDGYLDQYQARLNSSVPFKTYGNWIGKTFSLPVNYIGCVDELRYFNRRFDADTIKSMYQRTTLTPTESASLLIHMNFDDQATTATDLSGLGWTVSMGAGLVSRTPKYAVSTAPMVGTQLNFQAKQRPSSLSTTDPSYIVPMLIQHTYGANATVQIRIANLTVLTSEGTLMDGNKQPIVYDPTAVSESTPLLVSGNMLYFMPAQGRSATTGTVKAQLSLDVLSVTPNLRSQTISLQLDITLNRAPGAGNAGMAISCDGVDDFLYTPKFDWPVKNFTTPSGISEGAAPITIEFWAWFDQTSEIDGAVFSVGAQNNVGDSWAQGNPYQKRGLFHARFPTKSQRMQFVAGMNQNTIQPVISSLYGSWNHYAFIHEGANGTLQQMYVNGQLWGQNLHQYDGNANSWFQRSKNLIPIRNNLRGFSVCTWMHYSDIYHKGLLDDFRVWQVTRTQAEIQRDMNRQLVGNEPHLFTYWDFNDGPAEYALTGDEWSAIDRSPNKIHLVYGGCGPCESDYMGFTTDPPAGIALPGAMIGPTLGAHGHGVLQCVPSAQSTTSKFFDQALSYGALLCYGNNVNPSTRPMRIVSTAPLSGYHFPYQIPYQATRVIRLNATDSESDALTFQVAQLPTHGSLAYSLDFGVTLIPINQSYTYLPELLSTVWFTAGQGAGGANYASFTYRVSDGIATSEEATISISVPCPAGTTSSINVPGATPAELASLRCLPCPVGTYSTFESFASCRSCPVGTYQDLPGQRACKPCQVGFSYASVEGSSSCQLCDSTSSAIVDRLVLSETKCEQRLSLQASSTYTIGLTSAWDESLYRAQLASYSMGPQINWNTASDAVCKDPSYNQTLPLQALTPPSRQPQLIAYVTNLLRYGDLIQKTTDAPISDSFRGSLPEPQIQWAACVVNSSPSRASHSSSHVLGAPDTIGYGTSLTAWSPVGSPAENFLVYVDVQYETSVYASGVEIYETFNPGTIYAVEAYNAKDSSWFTMWQKSVPKDKSVIDPYNPIALGQRTNLFSPTLCATLFPTNRLRITMWLSTIVGTTEIDAIGLIGVPHQRDLNLAWIPLTTSSSGASQLDLLYTSSTPSQVGGSTYSDTISYVLTSCESLPYTVKRSAVIVVEIQPTLQVLSSSIGISFSVISCLGIVASFVMMAIIIVNHNAAIFKASSSSSLILNLWSVSLLFLQSLLINLQGMFPESMGNYCQYNSFLFGFASSILFASFLAKTYRLHSIFNATKLSKIKALPDWMLFASIGVIYAVDLLINLLWYGSDPLHPELRIKIASAESYYQCSSNHYSAFEGAHYSTKALLLASLLVVSIKVRNLPSRYNEARSIGMVAYNASFFAVLAIIVMQFIKDNINASYAIENFGLLSVAWGCIGFFYTPKFYTFFSKTLETSGATSDLKTVHNTHSSSEVGPKAIQSGSSGPAGRKGSTVIGTGGAGDNQRTRVPSFPLVSNVQVSSTITPREQHHFRSSSLTTAAVDQSTPSLTVTAVDRSPPPTIVSPQDIQVQLAPVVDSTTT